MLTVEKIDTQVGFEQLKPIWNPLLTASASNTITLTFEWLTTWWEVFGEGRELFILVVREDTEVVGIAPLLKRTVKHYGISYQRLEFLASGEDEADEICSDYLDFILLQGRESEVLEAIFHYLSATETGWDEIILADIAEESPNLKLLEDVGKPCAIASAIVKQDQGFYLPLPEDWKTYQSSLSRSFLKKMDRERRVAAADGGEFRVIECEEDFTENFDALIRLHQMRWTARGNPGVFASEKFTRFHRLLGSKLIPYGWVKLFMTYMAGEPIAALYTFVYNNKAFYYQGGFQETYGRLYSPGTLNLSYAVEKAIKMGLLEWDFLKGAEDSYKTRWGGQPRSIVQVRLAQSDSKEFIYSTTTRWVDGLRQIKRSLKR